MFERKLIVLLPRRCTFDNLNYTSKISLYPKIKKINIYRIYFLMDINCRIGKVKHSIIFK